MTHHYIQDYANTLVENFMCCVKLLPVNFSGRFHGIDIVVTLQDLCCLLTWLASVVPSSPYWTLCQLWNFNRL